MKHFKQLVKELPAKKVVFTFGRFQPPTTGHGLLVTAVKHIASKQGADHVIYASKTQDKKSNPLSVDRKVYYLKRMFPGTNFIGANEHVRTFIEAAKELNNKYKNLVMVAGSDRVVEYKKLLEKYNGKEFHFDTIEVISAGERDPDADGASGMSGTKMRDAAKKGDFEAFKRGLPPTLTTVDAKRLMNEIRVGMGQETIREKVELEKDDVREQYFAGDIFNVDDIVESAGIVYKIKKRGSNHLLLLDESGNVVSKWLQDVTQTDKEFMLLEGLTEMKFSGTDKIKVARVIANALGLVDVEKSSNPEMLINNALRKIRSKPMRPEYIDVLHKMLATAKEADIAYDEKLVPQKAQQVGEGIKQPNGTDKVGGIIAEKPRMTKEEVEISSILEQLATAAMMGKDTTELKQKLSTLRHDVKNNESDKEAEYQDEPIEKKIGHTMTAPHETDTTRKMKIRYQTESVDLEEAIKLGSKVKVHAPGKDYHGEVGHVGEIRDGAFKGAPKTYTVDYGDRKSVQLGKKQVKLHTEAVTTAGTVIGEKSKKSNADLDEDQATAEYKVKTYYDNAKGKTVTRKIRPHRVTFAGSKKNAEPEQDQPGEDLKNEAFPNTIIPGTDISSKNKVKEGIDGVPAGDMGAMPAGAPDAFSAGPSVITKDAKIKLRNKKALNLKEEDEEGEDISDEELEDMADKIQDLDDIIDVYDDEELHLVDDEGESVDEIKEETINEVLSRAERIRAKIRFAQSKSKRERKIQVALRTPSSMTKLNTRARRLAIKLMKQRIARKPLSSLSTAEKERVEAIVEKRKKIVNRLAMRLVSRVKKIEQNRLQHRKQK